MNGKLGNQLGQGQRRSVEGGSGELNGGSGNNERVVTSGNNCDIGRRGQIGSHGSGYHLGSGLVVCGLW